MSTLRGEFSSKVGFVMAATGSAVGLGNIWSFPTKAASNGGAAFVLMYFILAFLLAYPALMAELILGRHSRSNMVSALGNISQSKFTRNIGHSVGFYGVVVASLILSFYTIVAGWMLAYLFDSLATLVGLGSFVGDWFTVGSWQRDIVFAFIFAVTTILIITRGVENGIERWSTRLMPLLIFMLLILILYVMTQDGAMTGLTKYLLPNIRQLADPNLILDALGQAFFSLSLGVGTMLIYGSYLSKQESLPRMGAIVTTVDVGVAFVAGLLIIPAVYVAQNNGVTIFDENGGLISGPTLIFQALPSLFNSMGLVGLVFSAIFFALLSIAAITSSISMLEVPVSMTVEKTNLKRRSATWIIGGAIFAISCLIIFNQAALFGFVVSLTTEYSQPLLGVMLCIYAGWVLRRDHLLKEVKQGHPDIENSLFWRVWPVYVRVFCPLLIIATFAHKFIA